MIGLVEANQRPIFTYRRRRRRRRRRRIQTPI